MYNEKIEGLINAALADGELTEKEKQILFKNAEAQGIDLDEFEMVLDARLVEQKKAEQEKEEKFKLEQAKIAAQAKPAAPKSSKFGDVRKCPSCGAMLQSFQTKCDECGYEFKNVDVVQSSQKLFDLLQAAELRKSDLISAHNKEKNRRLEELSQKHNSDSGFVKVFGGSSRKEALDEEREDLIRELNRDLKRLERKADEEKLNIIKNFPVPNAKEDLLELLAMATSNAYDNDGVVGKQEEAWIQKCDQIYQKIIICAANDEKLLEQATNMVVSLMKKLPHSYKKFTIIPPKMMAKVQSELKAEKARKHELLMAALKKHGIWGGPCLLVALLCFILGSKSDVAMGIGAVFLLGAIVAGILINRARNDEEVIE